jgi:hypothetical protein
MISRISPHFSIRRISRAGAVLAAAGALAVSLTAAHSAGPSHVAKHDAVKFKLVHTPGVACLSKAGGNVTITPGKLNDKMVISVHGLPKNTGFDLFVIQAPNKPFGLSWYQTDVQTGASGNGTATVQGIFNKETFSVGADGTPVHQLHLGLWFTSPSVPFKLHCEGTATSPVITPFNGEQHAGIQILNTSNFHGKGPLAKVPA